MLTGKVALITGGSRGIGFAVAEQFIARGGRVVVTGRDATALDRAVDMLGQENALGIPGNFDDLDHQEEAFARGLAEFGHVDCLVNNVAINAHYGSLMGLEHRAAVRAFELNVVNLLSWTKRLYRELEFGGTGAIVNLSSVAGQRAVRGLGVYGATKAAIDQLTQQLAVELGPRMRVNAVAPAVIKTKFSKALYDGLGEAEGEGYPLGRLGTPLDVANLVVFLLSEEAAWITGQVINVDGGVTLSAEI